MRTSRRINIYDVAAWLIFAAIVISLFFGYTAERDKVLRSYTDQESLEYLCEKYHSMDCRVNSKGEIYVVKEGGP